MKKLIFGAVLVIMCAVGCGQRAPKAIEPAEDAITCPCDTCACDTCTCVAPIVDSLVVE